ncbi:MAG: hypothetical protein NTW74_11705 [Acidobacteria bacterium]|nr:hypothetical protein [Acidobacteriota bacterium]
MTEYQIKSNKILKVAAALAGVGFSVFAIWRGLDSALAFLSTAGISVLSLWVLARGIDLLGEGRTSWLKGFGFVVRFLVYALALSAILKVYPGHSLEVFFGIFLSILAIGIEALIESYKNART